MRIVVTRPREQADSLAERLEALGHEVVRCPVIEIEPLGDEPIDLEPYDWVVVTSPNGARELARRRVGAAKIAAVGPGTAAALREARLEPDLVADVSTQEGLVAAFPADHGRVLVAAAEAARRHLSEALDADFVALYRTRRLVPDVPDGDLVVLASASAARAWAKLPVELPAVSIGPETTKAAREAGIEVVSEADAHTLDGLVAAIAETKIRLPRS